MTTKSITDWAKEIHANRRRLGWYDDLPEKCRDPLVLSNRIAHIMREASEAWEQLRSGELEMWFDVDDKKKPEDMIIELADVVLLALDMAELAGLDIEEAMRRKMAFNETRPARHGGKLF